MQQVILPKQLSNVFQQFKSFYLAKQTNKGRTLNFFVEQGSFVLKARLASTFQLKASAVQALILLQFNGPANKPSVRLTISAIQKSTSLGNAVV